MKNFYLRKANINDVYAISELIYLTEKFPTKIWGNGCKEIILQRLCKLILLKGSRYYYDNMLVAIHNSSIIGVIVLINSNDIKKLSLKTYLKNLILIKGFNNKFKFIRNAYIGLDTEEGDYNSLYIANLAISKSYRNKGIGKKLILAAEKFAIKNSYSSLTLLAKDKNVKNFYVKCSFEYEKEILYFSDYLYKMKKHLKEY